MTNLVAALIVTVTTNWTDVFRVSPVIPESQITLAIYRPTMIVQRGLVTTNLIAVLEHKGQKFEVKIEELGSHSIADRTVPEGSLTNLNLDAFQR